MKLTDEERKQVVSHRLQRAKSTLHEARVNAELEFWHTVANRLYYACYYATSGLLVKHGHITRTHSGVINLFSQHFVSTGLISEEQGRFYSKLFEFRQKSDYNDWVTIQPEVVMQMITPAEELIVSVEKLILI